MNLAQPLITGEAIDYLRNAEGDLSGVIWLVVLLFALDAGSGLFNNINGYMGDRLGAKIHKILSERYYKHILELSQSYFDNELSGKIINRLHRSTQQISTFMNMMANNFLQFVVSTVIALFLVARINLQIAFLLSLLYPIFILMTIKTSDRWMKLQTKRNDALDTAVGRFSESINQIKVVKSFSQEPRELNHLKKYLGKFVSVGKPQSIYWHKRDIERRSVLSVIFFGVYLLIFTQAVNGALTAGEAVTLVLLAMQIRIPIFSISFLVDHTQKAVADSKDYFEIMSLKPMIENSLNAAELVVNGGVVTFQNVHFRYSEDSKVLEDISFSISSDSKVALVGESGEGKTTITNLLLRLYEPTSGTITIDGQDIALVTQSSLRDSISVVFQDPALFSGTIKENISYGRPDASDEEVINASKNANAHSFIEKFEGGYDTQIGERGLKLSGGQKQRIAIARALLKNAPILILDEATSSLDNKSEILVQEALDKLMKGRTTIIIAHRLSTIQNVDTIITLKNGRIDEIGSPKVLAKTKGIYSELLKLQNRDKEESAKKKLKEFDISS
jgi:ATP-binding cassette subfamily B protein